MLSPTDSVGRGNWRYNDVLTWGHGKGKLGHSESGRRPNVVKELRGLGPTFIYVGEFHSAAICDAGHHHDVYVWGSGDKGQLGRGDTESQPIPRLVISLRNKQVVKLVCGQEHTLALTKDGTLFGFGSNSKGQLGLAKNITFVSVPEIIKGQWEQVIDISCGNNVSCAISENRYAFLWGSAYEGLLATGDVEHNVYEPIVLPHLPFGKVLQIQFGVTHALALIDTGDVYSWGSNKFGQTGQLNESSSLILYPTIVQSLKGKSVVQISCGSYHSLCLTEQGQLFSFGLGVYGQLGVGNRLNQFTPVRIEFPHSLKGDKIYQVACGALHTIALTERGRVYSWGCNSKYQLGIGEKKDCLAPILLGNLQTMVIQSISCGGDSSGILTGRTSQEELLVDLTERLSRTEIANITIWVGTYNINAQKAALSSRSLSTWIANESTRNKVTELPDMIVVGFQELVNLSGKEVAKDLADVEGHMKTFAENQIEAVLYHSGKQYTQLFSKQLVGVVLFVYIKKELERYVKNIEWDEIRVGVMGKMGNKGAIAVRLTYHESQFCFVSSHLAAGQSKIDKRNQDYKSIVSKVEFASGQRQISILDHENIFWFGDFNYRLNNVTTEYVETVIQRQSYSELYSHDQLLIERQSERVFLGFKEAKINFAPTYKYEPFTTNYYSGEKVRTPAWCDRILYRGESIDCLDYSRHELLPSDHRPVSALFTVQIRKLIDEYLELEYLNDLDIVDDLDFVDYNSSNFDSSNSFIGTSTSPSNSYSFLNSYSPSTSINNNNNNNNNSIIQTQTTQTPIYQVIAKARVEHEYKADGDNELDLIKDDIINIVYMDNSGWWKAQLNNGKHGWVPSHFVSILDDKPIVAPITIVNHSNNSNNSNSINIVSSPPLSPNSSTEGSSGSYNSKKGGSYFVNNNKSQSVHLSNSVDTISSNSSSPTISSSLPTGSKIRRFTTILSNSLDKSPRPNSAIVELPTVTQQKDLILKQGYLVKKGHIRKNWKTRFFVLRPTSLSYYPTQFELESPLGVIDLTEPHITVTKGATGHDKKFVIRLNSKEYEIDAPTSQERDSWIRVISEIIAKIKQ